jgi:hypothetical protein
MKRNLDNPQHFLKLWIKYDAELWIELRDIQKRLLLERIVNQLTFSQMAVIHKVDEQKIALLFYAVVVKIEHYISKEVADHIREVNFELLSLEKSPFISRNAQLN